MKSDMIISLNGKAKWQESLDSYRKSKQTVSVEQVDWIDHNEARILDTIQWIKEKKGENLVIAEIGPAGIGLCAHDNLNCQLDAYDYAEWFKPLYDNSNIPWHFIDLNSKFTLPAEKYDVILLCEVIEHLCQWPIEVLKQLKLALKPGGHLFISTPNLTRLSNRLRMVFGKELFSEFSPESLVMGHLREYTPEEMTQLMKKAGFNNIGHQIKCYPDSCSSKPVQMTYSYICKLFPRLSNIFFIWGQK